MKQKETPMKMIPTVVIIPIADDESDAVYQAEELLELSAIDPYGKGKLNENGRWESFAVGWYGYGYGTPYNEETEEEIEEAIQFKTLDADGFFLQQGNYAVPVEDDDDSAEPEFIPEALVLPDGKWVDAYDLSEGIDWKNYFMETMHGLAGDNWLVFIVAAE